MAKNCPRTSVCSVPDCGLKHTKFLHLPRARDGTFPGGTSIATDSTNQSMSAPRQAESSSESVSNASANYSSDITGAGTGKVVLPIVPVKVRAKGSSSFVKTYALLDSGSTHSFCSEALTRKLGVFGSRDTISLTTLDQTQIITNTHVVSLEVADLDDNTHIDMTSVLTRPKLNVSSSHIVEQEELEKWTHLRDIQLPEVNTSEVHMLIGQDVPDVMIPQEIRKGNPGDPYAIRTILGWTLNGPITCGSISSVTSCFVDTDDKLQRQVKMFWKLDGFGGDDTAMSVSDRKVLSVWEQSLERDGTHFSMDIPFKHRPSHLTNNKIMAEHRLHLLGKRLLRDSSLKEKYTAGIADLLDKGYAEMVPPTEVDTASGYVWYLPHHPVIHPRKPDKLRIVFDCAAKYRGTSLNDEVHQGPDLTNKLIGVLLRFRQEPVALMADIESMFHQVHVNERERDVLRFLWWCNDDIAQAPQIYRMTAQLFGGVWSPRCASFALKHTAQENAHRFPTATIETVDKDFYVDDCLKSVTTDEKAILALGGFRLTKWLSNSREVLRSIPDTELAKGVKTLDLDQELIPTERALGVLWHVETDSF
jgi:hypothetical protein